MPTCQNCHNKWSWKQTFKRTFTSDGMTCPYCEDKQYLTSRVRKGSAIIPFIMITLIMLCNLFFGPSFIFFFALLGVIPLFFVIYPFFVEVSNKKEALW
ncbi:TIGR04104 family putative zinc finger protein [Virgibacillus salexigens]|uniref:TIGR04104 family putative zinc finger protein n=1 Tax=Virgibacillus salexigens TaxID=61016 RepID=UPI00190E5C6B|nr:TIGR04104 family putative zinc finger protein [Virgibacillus salexigens]